jgi:hypothetical protein
MTDTALALSLLMAGPAAALIVGQAAAITGRCLRCMRNGDSFKAALAKANRWE